MHTNTITSKKKMKVMLREMGRISVYGISLFSIVEIQIIEAGGYKVFGFL